MKRAQQMVRAMEDAKAQQMQVVHEEDAMAVRVDAREGVMEVGVDRWAQPNVHVKVDVSAQLMVGTSPQELAPRLPYHADIHQARHAEGALGCLASITFW
jgi:hypothetical protein